MHIGMQSLLSILRWFDRTDEDDIQPQLESLFTRGAPSKKTPPDTVHDKIIRGNVAEGVLWAMRALSAVGSGPDQTALPCLPH